MIAVLGTFVTAGKRLALIAGLMEACFRVPAATVSFVKLSAAYVD